MPHIQLNNVTKRFGNVTAVDGLNLSIEKGECFSILGPSGCGKTTTLRMIAGFEDLDEGEILVGGRLMSSSYKQYYVPPEKRDFGMVFQAFAVWPHMNVFQNVAFPLKLKNYSKTEIVEKTRQALKHTSLSRLENAYPNELSGGEKQRIALARALAVNPSVMLLDEPLSNLDPHLRDEMRFEIKELQRKFNFSIVYVTHDQSEAMALSDRIMVMCDGKIKQIDTPLNVYNNPADEFVFGFIGLSNFIPVEIGPNGVFVSGGQEKLILEKSSLPKTGGKKQLLACRPSEIDISKTDGNPAMIKQKSYLGELTDYRIQIGDVEIRVQRPRHAESFDQGEICKIKFHRFLWYPLSDGDNKNSAAN